MFLRNNNNWLRYRVEKRIKENHKELYQEPGFYKKILLYIQSPRQWWLIISLVVIYFLIGSTGTGFFRFIDIDNNTAKILIEQRISNIATVISITLVVVGFLINNLAVKSGTTYKLLFKKSYLYPIIYLTLSSIAAFIIISTLRNTDIKYFNFPNAVLASTYLVILLLFLIGFLFRTIIKFTNNDVVHDMLENELMNESKNRMKEILLIKYSLKIYNEELQNAGAIQFDLTSILKELSNNYYLKDLKKANKLIDFNQNSDQIVIDMNLGLILKFVEEKSGKNKKNEKIQYRQICLDMPLGDVDDYISGESTKNTDSETNVLKRYLILRKKGQRKKANYEYRNYFDKKIIEYSEDGNYRGLSKILDSYIKLFEIQFSGTEVISNNYHDITNGIDWIIQGAIEKSLQKNSSDSLIALESWLQRLIILSIRYRSSILFERYISLIPSYYIHSSYELSINPQLIKMHKHISKKMPQIISVFFDKISFGEESNRNNEDVNQTLNFYLIGFRTYSALLFNIIRNTDFESFKYTITELKKLTKFYNKIIHYKIEISNLEFSKIRYTTIEYNEIFNKINSTLNNYKTIEAYRRHTISGITYWIICLQSYKIINEETTEVFLDQIGYLVDNDDLLLDTLFFVSQIDSSYLDWGNWHFNEEWSPLNPTDWLIFGLLVNQIRNNSLHFNGPEIKNIETDLISFLYNKIERIAEYLEGKYDFWEKILKVESPEDLHSKCKTMLISLETFKRKQFSERERIISLTHLSPVLISKFKEIVGNSWKKNTFIHNLFKKHSNFICVTEPELGQLPIEKTYCFPNSKSKFIEGEFHSEKDLEQGMGEQVATDEDNSFFYTVFKDISKVFKDPNFLVVIEKLTSYLKDKGKTPNIIFISADSYRKNLLLKNEKFVPKSREVIESDQKELGYIGKFDNIAIYEFYGTDLYNRVVIADFEAAFTMILKKDDDWFESELQVDVTEVNDDEANRKLESNPGFWRNTDEGTTLSVDDALALIKTAVNINIRLNINFQIQDKEAFAIGQVQEGELDE